MSRISENIRKITKAWGGKTTGNGISDALSDLYNSLPFSVKTKDGQEIVKPLDYKFMPEGYPKVKTEEEQEVVTPMDYKFMPEGYPKIETKMVEIVPEQSVTGENEGPFCILDEVDLPNANFTIGSKVDVVLNGTKYSCVVKEGSGDVAKYVGNFGLMGNGENTGEPFVIFITDVLTYFWSTDLGETITLAIYEEQEVVTSMDIKFLPIEELKIALGLGGEE